MRIASVLSRMEDKGDVSAIRRALEAEGFTAPQEYNAPDAMSTLSLTLHPNDVFFAGFRRDEDDEVSYAFFGIHYEGEYRVVAGCQNFTLDQAIAYWHGREDGSVELVNRIKVWSEGLPVPAIAPVAVPTLSHHELIVKHKAIPMDLLEGFIGAGLATMLGNWLYHRHNVRTEWMGR